MSSRTLAVVALSTALLAGGSPAVATTAPAGLVRVDQVGFAPAEAKHAYLMTTGTGAHRFSVVDQRGREVLSGRAGADLGAWNSRYPHVYDLDLTRVRAPGRYRVKAGAATSPSFQVGPAAAVTGGPAAKVVTFFQNQRDGADVLPGESHRRPSHLTDRSASVYEWPEFTGPDTDQIKGGLTRIGGAVDVEGGWFDAGDYLKFTHILAYVDTLLLAAARDAGPLADPRLTAEAAHGLKWLDKMWDETTRTLYIQVGIGAGDEKGTFLGDHDIWRLPEADDRDKGEDRRFIRHRPVFRAAPPGKPLSPNLAGRTAAAFALAAQVEPDPARARELLGKAASVYALAKTEKVGRLVTSLPFAFYPESVWRDDMELGGAQLALAGKRLGDPRAATWLEQAAHWAGEYLEHDAGGDTLNLYDVSALAHADLIRALRTPDTNVPLLSPNPLGRPYVQTAPPLNTGSSADPSRTGATTDPAGTGTTDTYALEDAISQDTPGSHDLAVSEADLIGDLKAQLKIGAGRAAGDPFRAGARYDEFDSVPHAFGLAATSRLYRSVSGDRSYDAFGTGQRGWVFGANAWGVSFMTGAGENALRCPHHQIANLTGRSATGAVVNGPNGEEQFEDGLGDHFEEMTRCPAGPDRYQRFTGHNSRYADDVRSWQTSEPADDFAAIALYALTLMARD
ncbi:glycoside hydrolase family 9 protein [Streptosporangium soli]|nr:glycoside hydrolase family 9 protein [Streptosporangium sp. KLBMP 9127]